MKFQCYCTTEKHGQTFWHRLGEAYASTFVQGKKGTHLVVELWAIPVLGPLIIRDAVSQHELSLALGLGPVEAWALTGEKLCAGSIVRTNGGDELRLDTGHLTLPNRFHIHPKETA